INLRLFRYKNFAICCFLMALVGGVLNANTVLQPQFMQQLLGWNATTAGLALTAGGVVLLFVMPIAGYATGKVAARYLAVVGFILFVITFRYAADVTTAAYVGMPREESNQVAGLINFVRNIGGSILIAVTNAQVTSRALWHQQHLQSAMTSASSAFQQHAQALAGFFGSEFGSSNGQGMA